MKKFKKKNKLIFEVFIPLLKRNASLTACIGCGFEFYLIVWSLLVGDERVLLLFLLFLTTFLSSQNVNGVLTLTFLKKK